MRKLALILTVLAVSAGCLRDEIALYLPNHNYDGTWGVVDNLTSDTYVVFNPEEDSEHIISPGDGTLVRIPLDDKQKPFWVIYLYLQRLGERRPTGVYVRDEYWFENWKSSLMEGDEYWFEEYELKLTDELVATIFKENREKLEEEWAEEAYKQVYIDDPETIYLVVDNQTTNNAQIWAPGAPRKEFSWEYYYHGHPQELWGVLPGERKRVLAGGFTRSHPDELAYVYQPDFRLNVPYKGDYVDIMVYDLDEKGIYDPKNREVVVTLTDEMVKEFIEQWEKEEAEQN